MAGRYRSHLQVRNMTGGILSCSTGARGFWSKACVPALSIGHGFGLIPAPNSFTSVALGENGPTDLRFAPGPSLLLILIPTGFRKCLFLPRIFLGTASGQFLRPAASRLLLSWFLPNDTCPSHKAPARLGSRGLSLLGAPGKWGKKKENNSCLISTQ
jgi:hypothetical protein